MVNCVVCGKKLKDQKSVNKGYGPKCAKKLDQEARREIEEIAAQGFTPKILADRIIQAEIPIDDPGSFPGVIDGRGKKWNYPKGKR